MDLTFMISETLIIYQQAFESLFIVMSQHLQYIILLVTKSEKSMIFMTLQVRLNGSGDHESKAIPQSALLRETL